MDELPQLINIWKGDMSFVGPRALAVEEVSSSTPGFLERHQIRPGLTGTAQVYASRDISLEEKFSCDLEYIRTQTFWGDLELLFLSLWITLRGKWESRQKKL
jgi:lipopolysaccharide/colanic/teichoic acid biosynthesis glycosyltransferase